MSTPPSIMKGETGGILITSEDTRYAYERKASEPDYSLRTGVKRNRPIGQRIFEITLTAEEVIHAFAVLLTGGLPDLKGETSLKLARYFLERAISGTAPKADTPEHRGWTLIGH